LYAGDGGFGLLKLTDLQRLAFRQFGRGLRTQRERRRLGQRGPADAEDRAIELAVGRAGRGSVERRLGGGAELEARVRAAGAVEAVQRGDDRRGGHDGADIAARRHSVARVWLGVVADGVLRVALALQERGGGCCARWIEELLPGVEVIARGGVA